VLVPGDEPAEVAPEIIVTQMDMNTFTGWLRDYWSLLVYFEAFQDSLPRQAEFTDAQAVVQAANAPTETSITTPPVKTTSKVPSSVLDFIVLSDLDVGRVAGLVGNDKTLGNYLSLIGAAITGDFLTYWKQKVDKEETVDLRVRHLRDSDGVLKLAFYVPDKSDQYPDQRSKGFLWFLSFYLKLAAAQKQSLTRHRLLLIDEPGSYLHARAQQALLHLLEGRIAKEDQVIYSTHSPYLIPADRLHRLRIVLKKSASGTKILDRLTHPDLRGAEFADSLSRYHCNRNRHQPINYI
jgi:AAA ATPase domain